MSDLFDNSQMMNEFSNTNKQEHDELIDTMNNYMNAEFKPYVGIFWYDINKDELFGVYKTEVNNVEFDDNGRKMYHKLHVDVWRNEVNKAKYRNKPTRFKGDYLSVPRGIVIQYKDNHFEVMIGNWIKNYPNCKFLIIDEFDLPENNTKFVIDEHWDLGHGYSDKLF